MKVEELISINELNFQGLVNILKTIPNSGMFTTQLCCLDTELSGEAISQIDLLPHLINRGIGSPYINVMSSNKHKFVDNVNKYIMFSKVAEDTLI